MIPNKVTEKPYLNLLEPYSLVGHFLAYPPDGFSTGASPQNVPVFQTRFDLLTTADSALRNRISGLPLYSRWSYLLKPRTCFVGTTVSEYALFPQGLPAAQLIANLKSEYASEYPFLIIKDIPQDSPLLDNASNAYAEEIVAASIEAGFVLLEGQALAYVPIDFDSVDTYLSRLSHGRRKNIRRKLRARSDLDIEIASTGAACFDNAEFLALLYKLYVNVYRQSELHFDLLSEKFFGAVLQCKGDGGVVFIYRHAGSLVGYNICYVSQSCLIDKYVGFDYSLAKAFNLYFVSWVQNLEYALGNRLSHYVVGWTDPQIKSDLGASFTFTRHAVHIRNGLLRAMLRRLSSNFESDRAWHDSLHVKAASHS